MAIVEYYGLLRSHTGCHREQVNVVGLGAVFKHIRACYGREALVVSRSCTVVLNGKNYLFCDRYERRLGEETILQFFPPVAGG